MFMNTVGERIANSRRAKKLSQGQLAKLLRISRAAVSKWESGLNQPRGRYLNDLASSLDVSVEWLITGENIPKPKNDVGNHNAFSNVEITPIPLGSRVPIISFVQAGMWREMCEQFSGVDGSTEFVIASVDVGPCGFGLWLCGDSMAPRFQPGDLIIIDPDESPIAGDFVVAKNGDNEATFKKYRPRGINESGVEIFELVPLNEDFPTLYSDRQRIEIIGVMVEHRVLRKRQSGR